MTSERSKIFLDREEFLVAKFGECAADRYSYNSNKDGYVNLGTAQNFLCENEIKEWLQLPGHFQHQTDWQHYTSFEGHLSVRTVVARFLTEKLSIQAPINPKNLRYSLCLLKLLDTVFFYLLTIKFYYL